MKRKIPAQADFRPGVQIVLKEHLTEFLFAQSNQAIIVCDANVRITRVNPAFTHITGYSSLEACGRNPRFLSAKKQGQLIHRKMWTTLAESGHWEGELWNRRKDGRTYIEHIVITKIADNDGQVTGYFALIEDYTSEKLTLEKLKYRSNHDILTSVFNRNYIDLALDLMLEEVKTRDRDFAILYLNIDDFHLVNDRGGQALGDKLLKVLADRLLALLREGDIIGRVGSDEFCIILENVRDLKDASNAAQRSLNTTSKPIEIDGYLLDVSISIGVMMCSKKNSDYSAAQIVTQTSQAMKSAKIAGGNRFRVYDPMVSVDAQREATIYGDLKTVADQNELFVSYQKIQDVSSPGEIRFEALIRWKHPVLSDLSPLEFIPLAEKNGAINDIGKFIVESVCRQISIWEQKYGAEVHVSINISSAEFLMRPVAEHIFEALRRFDVKPKQLGVEVTESQSLQEIALVSDSFKLLRARGVSVSIDDFGTGYSSFSYIKDLPIDVIKIDKCFVDDITDNKKDELLILSIIEMAHRLQLKVVAEGVETEAQYKILTQMSCDYIQGYYLGKPEPVHRIDFSKTVTNLDLNRNSTSRKPIQKRVFCTKQKKG